ncbi:MAG: Fur family transcriptional regulator [Campylobacter sp.]
MDINNLEFENLLAKFRILLKDNGLKYTFQREALLRTLYNANEHFTPENLYNEIKKQYPGINIGIATVYRSLNLLEDAGIATSISFGIQGKKYELAIKPHHDHIICKKCGKIAEFEDQSIEKKQLTIAKENGFSLTGHVMQLYGICSDCENKK